jgi:hypothetical protein
MVAGFDSPRVEVPVLDVVIRCCIAKEDTRKIVLVQLPSTHSHLLHAHP